MAEASLDSLLTDMRRALLSEYGAHAFYGGMLPLVRDPELARVVQSLHEDEAQQVVRLRALMEQLGASRLERGRRRRKLAAWALVQVGRVSGWRFPLRVCADAESTVGRWYSRYEIYLGPLGRQAEARGCAQLAVTKRRHAQILSAWVDLLPRS